MCIECPYQRQCCACGRFRRMRNADLCLLIAMIPEYNHIDGGGIQNCLEGEI